MSVGMKGTMKGGWCDGRGNCGSTTEPLWLRESLASLFHNGTLVQRAWWKLVEM